MIDRLPWTKVLRMTTSICSGVLAAWKLVLPDSFAAIAALHA